MPRIVKVHFDVNGAESGTQQIICGSGNTLSGRFDVFMAWDQAEQRANRSVRATIKLVRTGYVWGTVVGDYVLIRDRATVAASDPAVPNFVWPEVYEVIGPLLGWKVTLISTTYTYSCSDSCSLNISSSRGGSYASWWSSESVRGLCTLRSAGQRYDRKSAANVTVECTEREGEEEVGYYVPGPSEEFVAFNTSMGRVLEDRLMLLQQQQEVQLAKSMEEVALFFLEKMGEKPAPARKKPIRRKR